MITLHATDKTCADPSPFASTGLDGGSAVGLVKATLPPLPVCEGYGEIPLDRLSLHGGDTSTDPGVIVFNPGELLYSHELNTSMSQTAWLARSKKNALAPNIEINEDFNRVPGHHNADAHIRTVFESIIPKIVNKDARVYVIGMSDGAESMLKYYDDKYLSLDYASNDKFIGAPHAIALMQSTHSHEQLRSYKLKNFLNTPYCAKSYIVNDIPKGTFLTRPGDEMRRSQIAQPTLPDTQDAGHARVESETSSSSTIGPVVTQDASSTSDWEGSTAVDDNSVRSLDDVSDAGIGNINLDSTLAESSGLGGSYDMVRAGWHQPVVMARRNSDQAAVADLVEITDSTSATLASQDLAASPSDLADSHDSLNDGFSNLAQSTESIEHYQWEGGLVSCPTISSGVADYNELVWPAVMDDVLGWFAWMSKADDKRKSDRAAAVASRRNLPRA